MSSEDPGKQDQPSNEDTAPYGQSPAGGGSTYGGGSPTGDNPYGGNPYGAPAGDQGSPGRSTGAHGVYGEAPYGAPSYPPPSQPSGYPPPPQHWGPQQPGYPYGPGGPGYAGGPGYPQPQQNDGLALGAMIVGIVSLVLTCGYGIGLLGSPVALVMGRISMKRIDRSGGRLAGRGMAQTGFILGIIGTILLVLALIAVVVVIVVAVNGGFDSNDPSNFRYNS